MSGSKRIGVMMDLDKPFKRHVWVYAGIQEYAKRHPEWKLIVDEWADQALPPRPGRAVPYDGIIGRLTKLGGDRARRLDLPAVNVWRASPAQGLPGAFPDFAAAGRLVADHLLSRGFRTLAALRQHGDVGVALQARAMKAFAEEAGFDGWLGVETIIEPKTRTEWRQGVRAVERWMATWKHRRGGAGEQALRMGGPPASSRCWCSNDVNAMPPRPVPPHCRKARRSSRWRPAWERG